MTKGPPKDIPGDAIASAQVVAQYWYNVGVSMGDLDRYRDKEHHDAPQLLGLNVRCDPADDMGILVIAKGLSEDGPVVAFHRDETIVAAVQGMARRLKNRTAKWKVDEYAK